MTEPVVLYEEINHIGMLPEPARSDDSLTYESYDLLEDSVRQSKARVIVITSSGRAFCAGDDVKQILGSNAPPKRTCRARPKYRRADSCSRRSVEYEYSDNRCGQWPAVGWGMELALMADIRVASINAKFGELFV